MRSLALVLLVAAAAVAGGCTKSNDVIQEGRHAAHPPTSRGNITIEAQSMNLFLSDGKEKRPQQWPVTFGLLHDGVFTVATAEFNLSYRVDEPMPVALTYDATLAHENTFNFTYTESVDVAGRLITHVTSVKPESRVLALTWAPEEKRPNTEFKIYFEGACRAGEKGCRAPDAPQAVGLEGRFPPR